MSSARWEILHRLRSALPQPTAMLAQPVSTPTPSSVTSADGDRLALARLFAQKLEAVDGAAEVLKTPTDATRRVVELTAAWSGGGDIALLSWEPAELPVPGLARRVEDAGIRLHVPTDVHDQTERTRAAEAVVGLTTVDAAFASTGTVLLASGPGRSRAASLLPLYHIVLVPMSRIHPTFESWLAERRRADDLRSLVTERRQLTFVTGPSKSADIELNLTLGVHGPRAVHALLFEDR